MFKKIVSNLSFSPSLIGQLSFYTKRLSQEELTRKLGLFFLIMTIIVQSLIVFQPSESANAVSDSDMIRGGISTKTDILKLYDDPHSDIKDILSFLNISRSDLESIVDKEIAIPSRSYDLMMYGRGKQSTVMTEADGMISRSVPLSSGGYSYIHASPLGKIADKIENYPPSTYVLKGTSSRYGYFYIKKSCGNIILPPELVASCNCNSLDINKINNENNTYRLSANTSAVNSSLVSVTYQVKNESGNIIRTLEGDKNADFSVNYSHGNLPGKYVVQAITKFQSKVDGSIKTLDNCQANFAIEALAKPIYTCNGLSVTKLAWNKFSFNVDYTAKDGAIFKGATFIISNSKNQIIDQVKTNLTNKTTYTIDSPGTYKVSAKVNISSNNQSLETDLNNNCSKNFIVEKESAGLQLSKKALNISQGSIDATKSTAYENDRINYILTIRNTGTQTMKYIPEDNLSDIVEYSDIVDSGNGQFDQSKKVISWPELTIYPNSIETRSFSIRIKENIPATAQGQSYEGSFDCQIDNVFGDSISIPIKCPGPKVVEQAVKQLPVTGPGTNIIISSVILMLSTYFFVRAKQLKRELAIVRKDAIAGSI